MKWLSDRGSSGVFFAVLAPSLLALAGLVLDGGRAIVSRQQAGNVALEAARAAASECDQTALFHGQPCEIADTVQACQVARTLVE
ncbi:MAG TPA: pilus assembly protein TadG-related protein, partial [Mycobacteriales bacterium]|nr:pilus assembly protein TadG-related protein [Mycobacteriales bacterium]